ncbi:MAG TPA: sensor histidine kinase N-terminal domain-containing protein [Rhizobacter sp.]|nr:sensor histidine kinase N-terminal domain-containing protein [Rhizobacter sp.]
MPSESNPTLRSKLLRLVLIPLSLVLLVDVVGSYLIVRNVADDVYDVELNEIARELLLHVTRVNGRLAFDLEKDAERTLLLDKYDTIYYAIRNAAGETMAGDPALPGLHGRLVGQEIAYNDGVFQNRPVRLALLHARALVQPPSELVGIYVAETRIKRESHQQTLLIQVILPQLLLILVASVLIWRGVAHGLAPLRQLQQAVSTRSHLDLSPITAANLPGEVEPLVHAVNDLMKRIHTVLGFQERFIADTAHQLRTPVAGLKAHIELALREQDMAQVRHALGHVYTSAERMSRLVSQLLSLARNEPHNVRTANFTPFDLNQLALRTTQEWVPAAYKKNIDLGFEAAPLPVLMNGEATRVTELINNLVDNAIRYTQPGGRVTVRIQPGDSARLLVSDDGPRIPIPDRTRIFERFHRLLGTHEEGSGLGLAIVHEIATLHEATISLEDDADGVGNTFTVSFPILHAET